MGKHTVKILQYEYYIECLVIFIIMHGKVKITMKLVFLLNMPWLIKPLGIVHINVLFISAQRGKIFENTK